MECAWHKVDAWCGDSLFGTKEVSSTWDCGDREGISQKPLEADKGCASPHQWSWITK